MSLRSLFLEVSLALVAIAPVHAREAWDRRAGYAEQIVAACPDHFELKDEVWGRIQASQKNAKFLASWQEGADAGLADERRLGKRFCAEMAPVFQEFLKPLT